MPLFSSGSLSLPLFVCLSVCVPVSVSLSHSICLSIYQCIRLSICPWLYMSSSLPDRSICVAVNLSLLCLNLFWTDTLPWLTGDHLDSLPPSTLPSLHIAHQYLLGSLLYYSLLPSPLAVFELFPPFPQAFIHSCYVYSPLPHVFISTPSSTFFSLPRSSFHRISFILSLCFPFFHQNIRFCLPHH